MTQFFSEIQELPYTEVDYKRSPIPIFAFISVYISMFFVRLSAPSGFLFSPHIGSGSKTL